MKDLGLTKRTEDLAVEYCVPHPLGETFAKFVLTG